MLVRFDNTFNNINLNPSTFIKDMVSSTINSQKSLVNCDTYSSIPSTNQTIDITTDDISKQVKKLISHFYPELSHIQHLELNRISGAMTNAVYFVTLANRTFVLRVYGVGCEVLLDRQKELEWLARLTPLKVGARLLGTFNNGRLEEYLPSKTLTNDCLHETNTSIQIAKLLARLHSIVQFYPPPLSSSSSSLEVWSCIYKWFNTLKVSDHSKNENIFSIAGISLDEIKKCQCFLDKLSKGNETIVFAHNDLQYGNILRLHSNSELVAVDFEYAGYNPRGYDIANHFIEWQYDYSSEDSDLPKPHKAPTIQQQKVFLAAYLENHHLKSSTTIDQLFYEVKCWTMACHLYWGLWAFVQVLQSDIDFDYASYGTQRLNLFKQSYNQLVSIGDLELL